ncbi:putative phosphatidate phosphatase isoform X2 [Cherax quadricarinatus]|nr:putative phosphatidate phosphatase isoform X2 [Cherax quadricarinatus]
MPTMDSKYVVRIVVDVLLLSIVAIPILLFFLLGKPYERGFNCDDESLRYPYKDSTVSTGVLYVVGMFLPAISMCLLELWRIRSEAVGKPLLSCSRKTSSWFWASYTTVGTFLFGCACSQLSTDIAKYSIGRLRPHFVSICKPDWSKINCTEDYIDPIPCTTPDDDHRMKEARLSFPSGHASFSAYTMIYLVIYLQVRFKLKNPKLVRPFLQFVCLMMTFYCCLSRISDYKHHWSDVLFGFLLGTTVAVLISWCVSDLFQPTLPPSSKDQTVFLQDCRFVGNESENDKSRTNLGE